MDYNKLVAVSGLPGLYELVNSKTDGAIVRSLDDKTTKFAATRKHQFSHLESIEIYTMGENVNLADIFKAMDASGEALPDAKDDKAVKSYFQKVYGDMDFDRVYASDMKKMVKWFDILKKNDIEIKLTEPEEEDSLGEDEVEAEEGSLSGVEGEAKEESPGEVESKVEEEKDSLTEAEGKKAPAKKKAAAKKKES